MSDRRRSPHASAGLGRSTHVMRSAAGQAKTLIVVPFLFVLVLAAAFWCWHLVRLRGLQAPDYYLDPRDITINTPPEWITAGDIKETIIRDASLDPRLNILDDKLTARIALAFAAHPWVEAVVRVEKFHPARVVVTLAYREPVAAVAHEGDVLPVDRHGVRLPEENFSEVELSKFPQIRGITFRRRGAAGIAWGDPRVEAGAQIAAAFHDGWHELGLAEIVPSPRPAPGASNVYTYELGLVDGTRINWGRQYLDENAAEPSATEKCQRLKQYVNQHGSLDGLTRRPTSGETRQ